MRRPGDVDGIQLRCLFQFGYFPEVAFRLVGKAGLEPACLCGHLCWALPVRGGGREPPGAPRDYALSPSALSPVSPSQAAWTILALSSLEVDIGMMGCPAPELNWE